MLAALGDPELAAQEAAFRAMLRERYIVLKDALGALADTRLHPEPFNSGFFALVRVEGEDVDALRRRLIAEHSVGLIAIPAVNSLRIAYGALALEDIPELVHRLRAAVI